MSVRICLRLARAWTHACPLRHGCRNQHSISPTGPPDRARPSTELCRKVFPLCSPKVELAQLSIDHLPLELCAQAWRLAASADFSMNRSAFAARARLAQARLFYIDISRPKLDSFFRVRCYKADGDANSSYRPVLHQFFRNIGKLLLADYVYV